MRSNEIVFWVLGGLFVILLIQNSTVMTLKIFFWEVKMSRIIFIILFALFGFAGGLLVAKRRR